MTQGSAHPQALLRVEVVQEDKSYQALWVPVFPRLRCNRPQRPQWPTRRRRRRAISQVAASSAASTAVVDLEMHAVTEVEAAGAAVADVEGAVAAVDASVSRWLRWHNFIRQSDCRFFGQAFPSAFAFAFICFVCKVASGSPSLDFPLVGCASCDFIFLGTVNISASWSSSPLSILL